MSATKPAAPTTVPASSDDLRLVLFGLPGAGKTSLLGALSKAAKIQQSELHGTLTPSPKELNELEQQVYNTNKSAPKTIEEVKEYPVRFEPISERFAAPPTGQNVVLIDCDGEVADNIMKGEQDHQLATSQKPLVQELRQAHAVLLVVDASIKPIDLEEHFLQFAQFLDALEINRGERVEVAGLPVILVLTKCDKLAQGKISKTEWKKLIEQRKKEVESRFRAFLEERQKEQHSGAPPFGSINLEVMATSTKQPELEDQAKQDNVPHGVGELFKKAFDQAAEYRAQYERSQRRLIGLVVASSLLAGLMAALALAMFVINVNTRLVALQEHVANFQFLDKGGPAEYLRGSPEQLRRKQELLQEIRDDKLFPRLPADSRRFVENRIEEIDAYVPYLEKMLNLEPLANQRTQEGLESVLEQLRNELVVPRPEWSKTFAGLLHQNRVEGAEAIRKAVQAVRNWYLDAGDRAGRLWTFADYNDPMTLDWLGWSEKVEQFVDGEAKPPFREVDPVPGVPGGVLTFSNVYRYDRVVDARTAWDLERSKLRKLLNVTAALGLIPATKERPAVLVFPRDLTLAGCKTRLEAMKAAYPEYETTFVRSVLPDFVQSRVRHVAHRQYEILLGPGRAEVLRQLKRAGQGDEETLARWQPVRKWLEQPVELNDWRQLARVLVSLEGNDGLDPIDELRTFLDKSELTIKIKSVTVEIPELRGIKPRAESRFTLSHPSASQPSQLSFEPVGDGVRDPSRRLVSYTYQLAEVKQLTVKPGERFWAVLPMTGGKEQLIWSQSRSSLYQFECLQNPPRLQNSAASTLYAGRLFDDVKLVLKPDNALPKLPDLLPQVKLSD